MPRLWIIHAHSVEEDERFFKRGAANREICLHAIRSAFLQIERGVETKNIRQRSEKERLILHIENDHGAIGAGEGLRIRLGGDDDSLRGRRLRHSRRGLLREQWQSCTRRSEQGRRSHGSGMGILNRVIWTEYKDSLIESLGAKRREAVS